MEATFKPSDEILKQLVTVRRAEVARLQQSQAEQLRDIEARGQARIRALRANLPKGVIDLLDKLETIDHETQAISKSYLADVRKKLISSAPSIEPTDLPPPLTRGR
jgi:hypothetical protein